MIKFSLLRKKHNVLKLKLCQTFSFRGKWQIKHVLMTQRKLKRYFTGEINRTFGEFFCKSNVLITRVIPHPHGRCKAI